MRRAAAALVAALALAGCGQATAPSAEVLARGDAGRGAQVFAGSCAACHATTDEMRLGPGMAGIFQPGGPARPPEAQYGPRLPNGQPIDDASVAVWLRTGGRGKIGYMPGVALDDQRIADLIAYLKTLRR